MKNVCLKYLLIITAGMAGLGAFSCSAELMPESHTGEGDLTLTARIEGSATKVSDAGWTGGETIGVKANGEVKSYNVDVAGNMSTGSSPFMWKGEEYEMTAWYPYHTGNARIELASQSTESDFFSKDLLYSTATVTSEMRVEFVFHHRMTRMHWTLKADGYQQEDVNNAVVVFLGYGAVSYQEGEMSCSPEDADTEITTFNGVDSDGNRYGQAMLVPCEMWDKPLIKVVIGGETLVYTPSQNNEYDREHETGVLTPGYCQKYTLSVSKHNLNVTMDSEMIGWTEGTIGDVTDAKLGISVASEVEALSGLVIRGTENGLITDNDAGFEISYTENGTGGLYWEGTCKVERTETGGTQTYKFTNVRSDISISYLPEVEAGYYYYDNGTWGPDAEKDGCATIGRVFYVGKHEKDKAEYQMDKIRGYVISTSYNDATQRSWVGQPGDAEYLGKLTADTYVEISGNQEERENDYSGYMWTSKIDEAFADLNSTWEARAPFWYAFKNAGTKAPESSSGWYIPTVAQMKDIDNTGYIGSLSGRYWSSQLYAGTAAADVHGIQEGTKTTIWAMRCDFDDTGVQYGYGWSGDPGKLLIVLTF